MKKLSYTVTRGRGTGTVLTPHRHADGQFVVSHTRFAADYFRVAEEADLPEWRARGYSVRMSATGSDTHRSPSLIAPASIEVREESDVSPPGSGNVSSADDGIELHAPTLPWRSAAQTPRRVQARFRGCLLGGAVGDALGAPVEFMSRAETLRRFGASGITSYAPAYGRLGAITDDTQMTLFTAEGLIRAAVRGRMRGLTTYTGVTAHAYLRWLLTQGGRPPTKIDIELDSAERGWLFQQSALHSRRAPGNTCLSALQAMRTLGDPARNDSKGCGGVMRVAPVGLFAWRHLPTATLEQTFELGTEIAAITHGHPSGSFTAGVLAVMVLALADGASLSEALDASLPLLRAWPKHEETLRALELARALADSDVAPEQAIAQLGEGWVAEEALAISVYCALVAHDFRHGVTLAVNHDGDSDSTGAITGNLLGTLYGDDLIPREWLDPLELREVITELAEDLYAFKDWDIGEFCDNESENQRVWAKYPGH